jgi:hypothetical protein
LTNNPAYWCPLVGNSRWRKRAKDGPLVGIKAKTVYPKRPDAWTGDNWMPDTVLALIQAAMLQGTSVGLTRLKSHGPRSHEIAADPDVAKVSRVIDEWLLIEYAVTFLPMNQAALVEAVSKSGIAPERLPTLGIELARTDEPATPPVVSCTPEGELYRAINRGIAAFEFEALAMRAVTEQLERARGRV